MSDTYMHTYIFDVSVCVRMCSEAIYVCMCVVGCAAGKGANNAKTELEKLLTKHAVEGISCKQAVFELAKM